MKRHVVAFLTMVLGSTMVFTSLVFMNAFSQAPEKEKSVAQTQFQVAPKPKKKKKKARQKVKQKPKKMQPNAAPPPSPNLASSLSSVSLGLPGVGASEMGDVSDKLLGNVKAGVMTEDSVDSKPKPMRRTAAAYPPRARAEGTTGYVTLNLLIDENGRVERVKVLEAKPAGVFDQPAVNAVKDWQFEPATYQGESVKVWARQTVRFNLT